MQHSMASSLCSPKAEFSAASLASPRQRHITSSHANVSVNGKVELNYGACSLPVPKPASMARPWAKLFEKKKGGTNLKFFPFLQWVYPNRAPLELHSEIMDVGAKM